LTADQPLIDRVTEHIERANGHDIETPNGPRPCTRCRDDALDLLASIESGGWVIRRPA